MDKEKIKRHAESLTSIMGNHINACDLNADEVTFVIMESTLELLDSIGQQIEVPYYPARVLRAVLKSLIKTKRYNINEE